MEVLAGSLFLPQDLHLAIPAEVWIQMVSMKAKVVSILYSFGIIHKGRPQQSKSRHTMNGNVLALANALNAASNEKGE